MTLDEILAQAGMTPEEIGKLDEKAKTAFTKIRSAAAAELERAASAQAAAVRTKSEVDEWWQKEAVPQLTGQSSEVATARADAARYKTLLEEAKRTGMVPEIPKEAATPAKDPETGKFVPGANAVPGSPQFMTQQQSLALNVAMTELSNEHFALFKEPLTGLEDLVKTAQSRNMRLRDIWAEHFKVPERKAEIEAQKQAAHDKAIADAAVANAEKKWKEANGSNPNQRQWSASKTPIIRQPEGAEKVPWTKDGHREQMRARNRELFHKDTMQQQSPGNA